MTGVWIGIALGKHTLEESDQKMQSKIQPRFLPSIVKRAVNQRTVVELKVERSISLIGVDGRFVKRVGRTNQVMSPDEIRQRLLATGNSTWDNQSEERTTIDDLDKEAVKELISKIKECARRAIPPRERAESTLEKLGLTEKGLPTRAAILLLGKNPQRLYMSAYIKAGRFKSPTMIVDDKEFGGTLFQQLESTMAWFRDRLSTKLLIGRDKLPGLPSGSLAQRQDVWEYPLSALREAVANALCHRNYASNAAIMIRLYDDHVSISNSGQLAYQLNAEDLMRRHNSYPPNKLIAEAFYNVGIIERWGTGTLLIADALKAQEQPPPEFNVSTPDYFELVLRATETKPRRLDEPFVLNDRQEKAIAYLDSHQSLTVAKYQKLFGGSKATATRDLAELTHRGLVIKSGQSTGTVYTLPPS